MDNQKRSVDKTAGNFAVDVRKIFPSNVRKKIKDFYCLFFRKCHFGLKQKSRFYCCSENCLFFQKSEDTFHKNLTRLNTKKLLQEEMIFQNIPVDKWHAVLATLSKRFWQKTDFFFA